MFMHKLDGNANKSNGFFFKSTLKCMGVTVYRYRKRVISGDKQDDAVVEWLSRCDPEELVIFIRKLGHLLKALPS